MHIALSIIIPTHNRADDLAENLSVLAPQCHGQPVEIIVVDSASDPDQAAAIAALQNTAPHALSASTAPVCRWHAMRAWRRPKVRASASWTTTARPRLIR